MLRQRHNACSRHVKPLLRAILFFSSLSTFTFIDTRDIHASEAVGNDTGQPSSAAISSTQANTPEDNDKTLFSDIKQYFGIRYRFGGQTTKGFDCSGFVRFMFGRVFDMQLPRSSREMSSIGTRIKRSNLEPGDLVFFRNGKGRINHVGIFVGNDSFVHSSLSKGITRDRLNEKYFDRRFAGAVRLLDIPQENINPANFEGFAEDASENSDNS